jgi:hypothetical protein
MNSKQRRRIRRRRDRLAKVAESVPMVHDCEFL